MGKGRRGEGRRYGRDRPQKSQAPKPMLKASPAPQRGPGTASPTLGKPLAPPTLVPPVLLPGIAAHRAHGTGEKMEGEREGDFRKQRERRSGVSGEDLDKRRNTRGEHHTSHIPELKSAKEIME